MKKQSKKIKQRFDVDQSVRIEELNRDTIIGLGSKKTQFSALLPRKTKRHFNEYFRRLGKPNQCAPTLFAASIIISFHKWGIKPSSLVVDTEYARHEQFIISILEKAFPKAIINIKRVGKNSPSHEVAYFTHRKKRKPDAIIQIKELRYIISSL